ncbi:flavin reductase [Microbacterium sp. CFH 31415]|uniref:flavin reductase n=1 Tax=Microbacterium sp. CFH 31415 TaxID=2921732 RepID=UPI001F146ED4|nr:flavin reductase [Microbacterium sp. CFH 31415]MCH6231619.1 flavin reductase [Microbacterium sp. CFH 31415]
MSEVAFDPRRFRSVLGNFPTGVVIVSAIGSDGAPVGMVVGSFTSVSLDPPLVAFLPAVTSSSYARLRESDAFCVSVLSAGQESICRRFARSGEEKFANVAWTPAPSGSPRLDDAVAWIDCRRGQTYSAGDHDIVVGEVIDLGVGHADHAGPLLFYQGGYGGFDARVLAAPYRPDLRLALQLTDLARPFLEELAARTGLQSYLQAVADDDLVITAARGRTDAVGMHIGQHLPLAPPFGSLFAATDAGLAQRWRALGGSEDVLARVRARGWSIGLVADGHDDAWSHIRHHGGSAASPARARAIDEARVRLIDSYDPPDERLDRDRLDVRIITAPIRDGAGAVVATVALFGLPAAADRQIVSTWIAEACATADAISDRIGAR